MNPFFGVDFSSVRRWFGLEGEVDSVAFFTNKKIHLAALGFGGSLAAISGVAARSYSFSPYGALFGACLMTASLVSFVSWRCFLSYFNDWRERMRAVDGSVGRAVAVQGEAEEARRMAQAERDVERARALGLERENVEGLRIREVIEERLREAQQRADQLEGDVAEAKRALAALIAQRDEAVGSRDEARAQIAGAELRPRQEAMQHLAFIRGESDSPEVRAKLVRELQVFRSCVERFQGMRAEAHACIDRSSERKRICQAGMRAPRSGEGEEVKRFEHFVYDYSLQNRVGFFEECERLFTEERRIYSELEAFYGRMVAVMEERMALGSTARSDPVTIRERNVRVRQLYEGFDFRRIGEDLSRLEEVLSAFGSLLGGHLEYCRKEKEGFDGWARSFEGKTIDPREASRISELLDLVHFDEGDKERLRGKNPVFQIRETAESLSNCALLREFSSFQQKRPSVAVLKDHFEAGQRNIEFGVQFWRSYV